MVKNLKKIREYRGLSQKDLGKMIGVEQQTISGYESFSDPSSDILCRIAKCLETTIDNLLGLDDMEPILDKVTEKSLSPAESLMVQEYRDFNENERELIDNTFKSLHKMKKNK